MRVRRSLAVSIVALAAALSACAEEPDRSRGEIPVATPAPTTPAATTPAPTTPAPTTPAATTPAPTTPAPTTPAPTTPAPTGATTWTTFYGDIQPWECLDVDGIIVDPVTDVTMHPCTHPHTAQAISTHEVPAPYPGYDAVLAQAETACMADGANIVASSTSGAAASVYYYRWVVPYEESYNLGYTHLTCFVEFSSPVSESM